MNGIENGFMKIEELLRKYADGNCSAEEEKAAKKWLLTNIANPAYDKEFEHLLETTTASDDVAGRKRAQRRLSRMIEADIQQQKCARHRKVIYGIVNTFVCAIAVLCIFLANRKNDHVVWNEVYTERGETDWLSLSDGTSIWMNSGTKVIYPSEFKGDTRNIFVDGEIYADVTSDKDMPFVVSASGVNVKVHGTKFSVKAFAETDNVDVALISGSVTMEDTDAGNGFSRTLTPGELIRYNKSHGTVEEYTINTRTFGAWQNNHNIRFINQSLQEITKDLERRFNVHILIEDETLAQTQYYASFINNEGLDKILHALNSNGSMNISKRHDTIVISPNK